MGHLGESKAVVRVIVASAAFSWSSLALAYGDGLMMTGLVKVDVYIDDVCSISIPTVVELGLTSEQVTSSPACRGGVGLGLQSSRPL